MTPSGQRFWLEETLFWRELDDRGVQRLDRAAQRRDSLTASVGLRREILSRIQEYVEKNQTAVDNRQLELVRSSYGPEELCAAVDVILDDRLTMGSQVATFEEEWGKYLGTACNIMANSGSSANLLALSALAFPEVEGHLRPGDEVLIGAVTWSTSVFPIYQVGCIPVFVDVDRATFNIDPEKIEKAITDRTRAIVAVHILGNPCDMEAITRIARRHNLWVIEDCCEAAGASIKGKMVGTFGDLSTMSYFFSHHMTTIEGGMVSSSEIEPWHDLLVSLRAHGWVRGRTDRDQWKAAHADFDDRWLFVAPGYNLRPIEISAAIGRIQLRKLPAFVSNRHKTRASFVQELSAACPELVFQQELSEHYHSAFGLGFSVRPTARLQRAALQACLESNGIQTRPIVGSNFARQPVMRYIPHRCADDLENAQFLHEQGLMIGNHHNVTDAQKRYVIATLTSHVSGCRDGGQ